MKQLFTKDIPGFVMASLDDNLQWMYETAPAGDRSVLDNAREQILLDLLRREVIGDILNKHITKCFGTPDTADQASPKLLSANPFMAPIQAFIHRKDSKAIAVECIPTKIAKQLKLQNLDNDRNLVRKSLYHCQAVQITPQAMHSRTKIMTLKRKNVANGTTSILFTVIEAVKNTKTLVNVRQIGQIGWITLQLWFWHPLVL